MLTDNFLDMLRCPETQTRLRVADASLVARLNRDIAGGKLRNRAGQPVAKPLDTGLVREDGRVLYPVVDEIPILLIDEGIELTGNEGATG